MIPGVFDSEMNHTQVKVFDRYGKLIILKTKSWNARLHNGQLLPATEIIGFVVTRRKEHAISEIEVLNTKHQYIP
jgi:hypothetical protein